jgi:L-lysine 2,3-aminomutase
MDIKLQGFSQKEIEEGLQWLNKEKKELSVAVNTNCLQLLDLEEEFDTLQRKIIDKRNYLEELYQKETDVKKLIFVLQEKNVKTYENAH